MKIDQGTIETLLFCEEGNDLDFKSESYKFTNAKDCEKGELLKDIIAFANSWRRTDAFILIGVKEVKGKRSQVVGINETLDDAKIQQFVNSKTNSPIIFAYQNITYENKNVGVIHIPCQKRPFYLKKDFGNLKRETVYLRRGSSTAIAKLDEIAQMGSSVFAANVESYPELELFFADIEKRTVLPNTFETSSLILTIPKRSEIPDYELKRKHNQPSWMHFDLESANHSYYRELALFIQEYCYFTPIYLAIENSGNLVARDVRIELQIDDQRPCISILDNSNVKKVPKSSYSNLNIPQPINPEIFSEPKQYLRSEKIDDHWLIEAGVHKVQPKSISWLKLPFYFAAKEAHKFSIKVNICSDDLAEPSTKTLLIENKVTNKDASLEDIKTIEHERWKTTKEYNKFLQRHEEMMEK
jgi:hypothetical protein